MPEASVMVVEDAQRYGLAQLHQLRGRVGRGARASHCYLVTSESWALLRLRIMERSQDGFEIAQADLEHRRVPSALHTGFRALGSFEVYTFRALWFRSKSKTGCVRWGGEGTS